MSHFHEIIKEHRLNLGYSQAYFANLLNVSRRSYQYYEAGKKLPSVEKLTEIANILGVSVDSLLGLGDIPIAELVKRDSIVQKFQAQDFSSTSQQIDVALESFRSAFKENQEAWSDLSSLIFHLSLYQINKHSGTGDVLELLKSDTQKLLEKLNNNYLL